MEVTAKGRRMVMIECNSGICNHLDYFSDLVEWLGLKAENVYDPTQEIPKGVLAFGDYLFNLDISDFDPRALPQTSFLAECKIASAPSSHQYWYHCLCNECIAWYESSRATHFPDEKPVDLVKSVFYNGYLEWCQRTKTQTLSDANFWNSFQKVCKYNHSRPYYKNVNSHLTNPPTGAVAWSLDPWPSNKPTLDETDPKARVQIVTFKPIAELKNDFSQHYAGISFKVEDDHNNATTTSSTTISVSCCSNTTDITEYYFNIAPALISAADLHGINPSPRIPDPIIDPSLSRCNSDAN